MGLKKLFSFILGVILVASTALAQSVVENPKQRMGTTGSATAGLKNLSVSKIGSDTSIPSGYKGYTDDSLDEFNRNMKEQEWGREDTAWALACDLDATNAYEKYLAMYPNGAHASEASVRLVRARVNETLANAHSNLPDIKRIEEDDDSPETTLVIENNTGLALSVYCSGTDTRSIVIPPDRKGSIKILNGHYKIAASVPPAYIKPFAGQTSFQGGVYEIGFWIVSR